MKPETLDFLIGILFSAIISYFLTFVAIWQLIVIPGLVAGIFNKKMKPFFRRISKVKELDGFQFYRLLCGRDSRGYGDP